MFEAVSDIAVDLFFNVETIDEDNIVHYVGWQVKEEIVGGHVVSGAL